MIARNAHARAMLSHLRASPLHNPKRTIPKRIPKQRQPDAIRVAYYRAIRPVVERAGAAFDKVKPEILRLLRELRTEQGRADHMDADQGERASRLVAQASEEAVDALRPDALHNVARKFGQATSDHQREQLDKQVQAAIGVPYAAIERPTRDKVEGFAALNVDLIKTVPERYFDRLRRDVEDAFAGGMHPETLAERFEEDYDIAENDAMRIARDQIGKLNAEVNQDRQEALGITSYIWRTMNDERVRDEHVELEGEEFQWGEGGDEDGNPPGEAVQCRCIVAEAPVRLFNAMVDKAYRRAYRGPIVALRTSAGLLRCTPNHPVLTSSGWIEAHLVNVGDYVFEAPVQSLDLGVHDPQRRDSSFEELFRAVSPLGIVHRIDGGAAGFHGDGTDEKVDVISIDRGLWFKPDLPLSENFCEQLLARANGSIVRSFEEFAALLWRQLLVPLDHSLGSISRLDAIAHELSTNSGAADTKAFRERLHAFPLTMERRDHVSRILFGVWGRSINAATSFNASSAKELGQVVALAEAQPERVRRLGNRESVLKKPVCVIEKVVGEVYIGHVYNLQTTSGWYVTQNMIVHNCYAEPNFSDIMGEGESSEGESSEGGEGE